ncbi:MAG TPA: acyltransferase [Acidobacteriaceae bacterium]|nr:acyltransferase [Acidobacteriaceae bacterium]
MPSQPTARVDPQPSLAESKGHRWHLRRITSGGSWIPEIDGLRFVAISSVVLYHIYAQILVKSGHPVAVQSRYAWLSAAFSNGDRGVRLFFVISGFILGMGFARQHLHLGKPVSLKKYFLRRVTRLEPPYILNLVFCALVAFFYYHQTLGYMVPHLLVSVLYQHNLVYRTPSVINGVAWSLEVEIQFYILAPLIALLFRISNPTARRSIFLGLIAVSGILQLLLHANATVAALTIVFYVQYFLAGMLLTDLYLTVRPYARTHWAWDIVSLCGWPVVFLVPRDFLWYHAILPFLIMLLYIAAFQGVIFRKFFSNLWIAIIGGMCYSIYLWHFFTIGVFFKLTRHLIVFRDFLLNFGVQVVALGIPIAVVSLLAYVLVERPCMDPAWPRKFWRLVTNKKLPQQAAQ